MIYRAIIYLLLGANLIPVFAASTYPCYSTHFDQVAIVDKVYDGDTLRLQDGTHIRIIGINAPEFAYRQRPQQPFARPAKHLVEKLLTEHGNNINLRFGTDRYDRYHRTLAHVFLADGSNLAARLLSEGLATRVAFPPNLWSQACYNQQEKRARVQTRGLWGEIIKNADALPESLRGYHLVEGIIERIGHSKKSVWLNFNDQFAVRIARQDMDQFADLDIKQLAGRKAQVRGWVFQSKNKNIIRLRHSSMLEIMK